MLLLIWFVVAVVCACISLYLLSGKKAIGMGSLILVIVVSFVPVVNLIMVLIIFAVEYEDEICDFLSKDVIRSRRKED